MTELVEFAGRFHPILVHLPIGILLLAGILEIVTWIRLRRQPRPGAAAPPTPIENGIGTILVLGAVAAVAAALAGLMLGATGGYAGGTYDWHLALGIAVAIAATASAAVGLRRDRRDGLRWRRPYAWLLAITIVLLTVAGHLGATLAHGEGYLTNHAPQSLRRALLWLTGDAPAPASRSPEEAVVYTTLVHPILSARCASCHGPHRSEGGLRLDTPDGIGKGGDDGAVVIAGKGESSELVKRIWLPASHADVMPPRGQRPPTPAEAAVLRWWIDQGASFDQTLGETDLPPDIAAIVETLVGRIERGPTIPRVTLSSPDPAAIDGARQAGFSVTPIADGTPFLYVHCTNLGPRCDDVRLRAVEPLAPHVLWLDLGGTSVTDDGLAVVARLTHVTELHLQRTPITDAGIAHLARLPHLEYLNLYGTRVTDEGLMRLGDLETLRTLYVWQTNVTSAGVTALTSRLPRLDIETGDTRAAAHQP